MKLKLVRYGHGADSTGGLLLVDDIFFCYTCEDEKRAIKVAGETRIPEGTYEIKLRTEGGMHDRYAVKFPSLHKGMLHLQNVPNFEWVYLHIGNDDTDTAGCPLVGFTAAKVASEFRSLNSTAAYKELYRLVIESMDAGERVFIEVSVL